MTETTAKQSALSRITPAETLAALALVQKGEVIDLATELHRRMPFASDDGGFFPFRTIRNSSAKDAKWGEEQAGTSFSNETVMGCVHFGTHFDALCHVQFNGRIFGGALATEAERDEGWSEQGIETVKPVVTRGVLIDVASHLGVTQLPDTHVISIDEVKATLAAKNLSIQQGDAVLLRTGTILNLDNPDAFERAQSGLSADAAIWMYEQGMALLCADNLSVEAHPFPTWKGNLHVEMLYHRGVHLVEWVNLEPLRAACVTTCCFVVTPLKIRGATGSWVRPIAIV